MQYYGIKTPGSESYIGWISTDSDKSWEMFFTLPDKDGNDHESRPPSDEAKQAYEAIGYQLVEIEINES